MFGSFLEDSDYTLEEVIKEIKEEIHDNCLVKCSMDYSRHIHVLRSIVESLEKVLINQKKSLNKG